MKALIHDFNERLQFSQAQSDQESAWIGFYQQAWPMMLAAVRLDANSKFQQHGIDRHVYLPNGKILAIDEKIRDPNQAKDRDGDPYEDILLEEISVFYGDRDPRNRIGWALDSQKQCDYIAYAIPLLSRCYLLPFELLHMATVKNLADWKTLKDKKGRRCYPLDAPNRSYITRNCAVPWPILQAAISNEMRRVRSDGLALPIPTIRGHQAEFDWNDG